MWIAAGCLVLLVLGVVAIGAALPVQHRASRTASFKALPAEVYAVLTEPPDWHPGVAKWEKGDGGLWTEYDRPGGPKRKIKP